MLRKQAGKLRIVGFLDEIKECNLFTVARIKHGGSL